MEETHKETITDGLNGQSITYTPETNFLIQVGRGTRGEYKTRYCITGDLCRAVFYYEGINIGNRFKKRLVAPSLDKKPILQAQSW